ASDRSAADRSAAGPSAGAEAPRRAAGSHADEPVPSWAQWQEAGDGGEEDLPPMRASEPRERGASRALRAAARRRRRWLIMGGGGSATSAATDAYQLARQELRTPPKNAPAATRAAVRELTGFGDAAFTAQQVFHVGGAVTDVATVMVRYRNVVVTVTLNGLAH